MVASLVGTGALLGSTGADITPVLPTHLSGDILFLQACARSTAVTLTTPSGWTLIGAGPTDQSTTWRSYWYWKRAASASETNPLCDWSATTGDKYGRAYGVREAVSTGTPYEASQATAGTADPGNATGVTTLSTDALLLSIGMAADDAATSVGVIATDPISWTMPSYEISTTGADAGSWAAWARRGAPGATGTVIHDFNAAPLQWCVLILSVISAPTAMLPMGNQVV